MSTLGGLWTCECTARREREQRDEYAASAQKPLDIPITIFVSASAFSCEVKGPADRPSKVRFSFSRSAISDGLWVDNKDTTRIDVSRLQVRSPTNSRRTKRNAAEIVGARASRSVSRREVADSLPKRAELPRQHFYELRLIQTIASDL